MFAFHVGNERSITFYSSTFHLLHPNSLMTQLKIRSRYSHLLGALSRLRHHSFAARSTAAAPRAPLAPRLFDRYVIRLVLYVFGYKLSDFKIVRIFLGWSAVCNGTYLVLRIHRAIRRRDDISIAFCVNINGGVANMLFVWWDLHLIFNCAAWNIKSGLLWLIVLVNDVCARLCRWRLDFITHLRSARMAFFSARNGSFIAGEIRVLIVVNCIVGEFVSGVDYDSRQFIIIVSRPINRVFCFAQMRHERDLVDRRSVVLILKLYQLLEVLDFLIWIVGLNEAGRYFIRRSPLEPLFVFLKGNCTSEWERMENTQLTKCIRLCKLAAINHFVS